MLAVVALAAVVASAVAFAWAAMGTSATADMAIAALAAVDMQRVVQELRRQVDPSMGTGSKAVVEELAPVAVQ